LTEIRRKKSYETRVLRYQAPENDSAEKQQNDQETLHRCIAQLDEPDRVLTMLILVDLSHRDIARILGITEVNARVKVHRVKEKLHKIYQELESH
jgi:RNA polymerase sigma-70 factor (ECF subfamily)